MAFSTLTEHKISFYNVSSCKIESSFKALDGLINDFIVIKDTIYVVGSESAIRFYHLEVTISDLNPFSKAQWVR